MECVLPEAAAMDQLAASFFSGDGGLVSTLHDYFRFCQMLYDGGNESLVYAALD
jgi:CubicO group peptidase (beta-lactamase class C family)